MHHKYKQLIKSFQETHMLPVVALIVKCDYLSKE